MISKLDDLLTHIGTGKWSYMHILPLCYSFWIVVMQAMNGAFMAPKLNFSCRPPAHAVDRATPISALNESVILSNVTQDCAYSAEDPVTGEVEEQKCTEWDFDNSTFSSTVTSEFELVCGWEYLRALYTSIYMFGVFFGSPLNGFLADKYGRKPLVLIGALAFVFLATISTWLPNLSALLVARFLLGLLQPNTANTGYILAIEVAEPRFRTALGIMLFIPWAMGEMFLGGLAYLIRDWRTLQLTVSVIGVVMLPFFWFMDESPRWLAVRGDHDRAVKILQKAGKWNKVSLPPENEVMALMRQELPPTKVKCEDRGMKTVVKSFFQNAAILFRTPKLRLITSVMYLDYLVLAMVYYGLSLSGGNLSSDPFVYMVLSGLMEIPAYTGAYPLVAKFGRRIPTVMCCFVSGAALLVLTGVPKGYSTVIVTLALVGKMAITAAYQIAIFFSSELFPTEVRSRGVGTCFMLSRVGSMAAPFITDFLGSAYPASPSIVFGVASLLAGTATLALPETLGVALPDTIAHLEERNIGATSSCCKWMRRPSEKEEQQAEKLYSEKQEAKI
ncbi:organic cation transporter protein-like [Penaeus monodon]|uniref:organic cation transporter protein-like n=1 Tax=Penaeus monodon TaxID=6687 RepID=UPI0018A7821B|nr:organic cation transporter protein-like [Penaeus monodon]